MRLKNNCFLCLQRDSEEMLTACYHLKERFTICDHPALQDLLLAQ